MSPMTYREAGFDIAARLRQLVPFSGFKLEDLVSLMGSTRLALAPPGTVLQSTVNGGKILYVLLEGSVSLLSHSATGPPCVVEVCDAPCLVGETALFDEQAKPIVAQVLQRAELLELPAERFLQCLRANPVAQLRMLGYMSTRLKRLIIQISALKLMTGSQRLASFLVSLAERRRNGHPVHLPFEKRVLAGLLGMNPETLSRAFRRLSNLGVESMPGGDVAIADIDRLRHFVEAESAN